MSSEDAAALTDLSRKPGRGLWRRVIGWSVGLLVVLVLGMFVLLEVIAHRPSRVHGTLTAAEIGAENARLKQFGLVAADGSFLKEHPFEPPWTTHSLLVPSSWSRPSGVQMLLESRRVRADLLLADLDVLEPVMQRAYGGWESAEARGWSWDRWFVDWRKRLVAGGTAEVSFDEAFAPMDALIAFQRDNHTQIPLGRSSTSSGSQTAVLARAPDAACVEIRANGQLFSVAPNDAGQRVRTAKLWTSAAKTLAGADYISMPVSYGVPQAVRCGDAWIPVQPIGGRMPGVMSLVRRALGRDRPRIERFGDGIVYARLPTFMSSNYEQISRQGWAQRQPGDRVLIVDLRDNGGGSWGYGREMLRGWIDESRMAPVEDIGAQITSSCLYAPLKWNQETESRPTILPDQKEFLQGLLDRMRRPYPPGCPRTVDVRPAKWTYLQRRFDPAAGAMRIVALVNSHCGSDCELIVAELASLHEAIVAGTNTFGVGQFLQPGYSVLPHTGLPYRIALGRSDLYGDNRSFDGYGLDVDIVLPEVDTLKPEQMRELAETVAKF